MSIFQEFVHQYRIIIGLNCLPPPSTSVCKDLVINFIAQHPIVERQNIQFGATKIFMRDQEKLLLDDHLHRQIVAHVRKLQNWFRVVAQRRRYLRAKCGIVRLQVCLFVFIHSIERGRHSIEKGLKFRLISHFSGVISDYYYSKF